MINPELFDFTRTKASLDRMIGDFEDEKNKTKLRRDLRRNARNVAEEQQKRTILPDETIIPDRTINTNITRGRVAYVDYTTRSQKLLLLKSKTDPTKITESVENWFSTGMKFPSWKMPWLTLIDSIHVHGGGALEVVYDPEKPFNCAIEFIPREDLIIPSKLRDIQASPYLLRTYELTGIQFADFAEQFEFDPTLVETINRTKFKENELECVKVYKVLCKKQGLVYNAWYSQDDSTKWLREPRLHEIGLFEFDPAVAAANLDIFRAAPLQFAKSLPLRKYPIFWFTYQQTEELELLKAQGRAGLDMHVQEALTHLLTNTVNATTRASCLYPSAENDPGEDPSYRELGPLKHGVVMSRKLSIFQAPWPSSIILPVMQALSIGNAEDSGQADFASMARKDANKTATEMELAQDQSSKQSNVNLITFSSPFLDTYGLCFMIASHQAIFGLCMPPPNEKDLFDSYAMQPAGDIEVIRRAEETQNASKLLTIFKGTPVEKYLAQRLLEIFFPDKAAEWAAVLDQPDKDSMILQLTQLLETAPTNELTPDQQGQLRTVIETARGMVAPPVNGQPVRASQGGAAQPAQPSNAA